MSMQIEELKRALEAAYLAGFSATGEGYNAEYPFEGKDPEQDEYWLTKRDEYICQALEKPAPAQENSPWCMKMNGCKTKCEDCPDEVPKQPAPAQLEMLGNLAAELFVVAQTSPADNGFSETIERIESWLRDHFSAPPAPAQPQEFKGVLPFDSTPPEPGLWFSFNDGRPYVWKEGEWVEVAHGTTKVPQVIVNTKFYHFDQNNSGGSFDVDKKVAHNVIIEATSADHANQIAEDIGIYFDGCDNGADCTCCGDRWYRASEYNATESPTIYGQPIEKHKELFCGESEVYCYVYYMDGTVKSYVK